MRLLPPQLASLPARADTLVRHCELSLLDFRALLGICRPLAGLTPLRNARGPSFMISLRAAEGATLNEGAADLAALEPIDRFVISHASGCLRETDAAPPKR